MAEKNIKTYMQYIHILIVVLLMFGFGKIPAPMPMTQLGMQILGIFFGAIYGWTACSYIWPSILGMIALGFTEYTTVLGAFQAMFSNNVILCCIAVFILNPFIISSGLGDAFVKWFTTRKFLVGHPWTFAGAMIVFTYIGAAFFDTYAMIFMLWTILEALFGKMGFKKGEAFPTYVFFGTVISAFFGGMALPFRPAGIFMIGLFTNGTGIESLSYFQYFVMWNVITLSALALHFTFVRFFIKIDASKYVEASKTFAQDRVSANILIDTRNKKLGLFVLLTFITILLLPSFLPTTWKLTAIINNLGIVGTAFILLIIIMILKDENGKPVADFKSLATQGISWDILWLLGAVFIIATAVTSAETGVMAWLMAMLIPILSKMPFFVLIIALSVGLCLISQFANNMVLQFAFTPIAAQIVMGLGYHPACAILAVFFGASFAYLTPGGSNPSALAFGNEWVGKPLLYKFSIPYILIGLSCTIIGALVIPTLIF